MIKPRSKECFGVSRHVDEPEDRKPPLAPSKYEDVVVELTDTQKLFLKLMDSLQKDMKDNSKKQNVPKVIQLNQAFVLLTKSFSEFLNA